MIRAFLLVVILTQGIKWSEKALNFETTEHDQEERWIILATFRKHLEICGNSKSCKLYLLLAIIAYLPQLRQHFVKIQSIFRPKIMKNTWVGSGCSKLETSKILQTWAIPKTCDISQEKKDVAWGNETLKNPFKWVDSSCQRSRHSR